MSKKRAHFTIQRDNAMNEQQRAVPTYTAVHAAGTELPTTHHPIRLRSAAAACILAACCDYETSAARVLRSCVLVPYVWVQVLRLGVWWWLMRTPSRTRTSAHPRSAAIARRRAFRVSRWARRPSPCAVPPSCALRPRRPRAAGRSNGIDGAGPARAGEESTRPARSPRSIILDRQGDVPAEEANKPTREGHALRARGACAYAGHPGWTHRARGAWGRCIRAACCALVEW
jgi:hypothetical protein